MSSSAACRSRALAAARAFRIGAEARGHDELARLTLALTRHLAAAGLPAATAIAPLLPEIVAAQTRGDAIRLADLLEHELTPRL